MSERRGGSTIRVRTATLVRALVALVAVVAVLAVLATGMLARAATTSAVASPDALKPQQAAAERDVERAYEKSVEQVRNVRALKLAISTADAEAIANKALGDLKTLRHSAFVSLGQALGLAGADADRYATATEQHFDQSPIAAQPSAAPVLLAPRLYQIAARMSDLATQISDKATNDMTAAPPSTPAPSGTARPSPSPTRP